MYKIVPDTNFLIYVFKHKINFDYEIERAINSKFEIVILSPVKEELEKLLNNPNLKGKERLAIRLALNKIKNYKIVNTNSENYADEAILKYALQNKNVIVATNDKELKEKLIENNIPVMVVRQKKYFEVFGML
ncbi:PIN domain-containing protein [Methanocaldococcus lauensis]|uniref:PIN domain-containing protein n=1 Tax=Methanocaldococcus lauensis TaxID=2546128 RepID=UPI001BDC24C3|nr:PIN domain-containing protein [Methanocaldococcus lauensis]